MQNNQRKNEPITAEYAFSRLKDALTEGNQSEIEKWDTVLRAANDFRIRVKQKVRAIKDLRLRARLKEMYKITL